MDLRHEIWKEHSKAMAYKVADYVGKNGNRFKALLQVYQQGPYRVTQRAAYPIGICVERHPDLIIPHLALVLNFLDADGIHDAVKRNTMRMLQFIEIPKRFQGRIMDVCFKYLQSKQEPVAVKVFSMTVLARLVADQPDLQKELRIILEDQIPYASAGYLSRAKKILPKLKPS